MKTEEIPETEKETAKEYTESGIYESMNFPVMICGSDHTVIYKNPAAKRSVPSPRVGSGILKYLSGMDRTAFLFAKGCRIVRIELPGKAMTAFVFDKDEALVLVFPLYLQLISSEIYISEAELNSLCKGYKSIFADGPEIRESPGRPVKKNAEALRETFCRVFEYAGFGNRYREHSGVFEAVERVMSVVTEVFRKYKYRVVYNTGGLAASYGKFVSFAPFAFVVLQTVLFMTELSNSNGVGIDFSDKGRYIEVDVYCPFEENLPVNKRGYDFLSDYFFSRPDLLKELDLIISLMNWQLVFKSDPKNNMLHAKIAIAEIIGGNFRIFTKNRIPRIGRKR